MSILTQLKFVKKNHEGDDVHTFYFGANRTISHKAGQHGIFLLPGFYRPHPFSLSSAPDEKFISFSTHVGTNSAYKRRLLNLKPGDAMWLIGPMLNFTLSAHAPNHVLLAQGIGITPFRSMVINAHEKKMAIDTTLIHVDSRTHTFKNITRQYTNHSFYPSDAETFRMYLRKQATDSMFYLSGSPRFVSATKRLLKEMGVARSSIKTDAFLGY